jgi:mono/diheme cytochrome c family protein
VNNKLVAAVACLVILPVLGGGVVYGWSEIRLQVHPALESFAEPIPTDSASLARGRHVARTRGCVGCHGEQLQGHDFSEAWPRAGRPVAPNLAKLAREYDASVLEAAIRQGVGHDGRALWSMPSYNFAHLTDSDVAALIGFLASSPVVEVELPSPRLSLRSRWALVRGTELHMVDQVAALPPLTVDPAEAPQLARGEYLAMTTCNECHGLDLRGTSFPTSSLRIFQSWQRTRGRTSAS